MNISNVLSRVVFQNYPSQIEENLISAAIGKLYATAYGKQMIDAYLSDPAKAILFEHSDYAAEHAGLGLGHVRLDTRVGDLIAYINYGGIAVQDTLEGIVAHELVHALEGLDDNWSDYFDFSGDTIQKSNIIYEQLSLDPDITLEPQLSYTSGAQVNFPLIVGKDYALGKPIDRAGVWDLYRSENVANDLLIGQDDLAIGANGASTLDGGAGDDIIYGGIGNDRLFGDSDDDMIFGESEDDKLFGGTGRDSLFGDADNDQLSGGTKDNVLTQLVLDGSSDTSTEFFDDEEQDLLEGGTGSDTYYVHAAEHTLDAETADPLAYFDFIGGWDLNYEVRNGFKFDDTLTRFQMVDRIKDVDGNGDIRMQEKLERQFLINEAGQTFDRISYQGVDFFADEEQYIAAFLKDGDLHVMTSYRQAEYGDQIDAHWSGYVATVIIEDFSNGNFNFNLPGADEGTNSNDTPALTPPVPGKGAYYHGLDGDDIILGTTFDDALRGDAGNDQISGGDGNDDVSGGDGNDTVSGEDGNDFVSGGAGDDNLSGGAGDDWIRGGTGRDTVSGGSGNDTIYFDNGDYFWTSGVPIDIGGTGTDTLIIETGSKFNTSGLSWYGFERFRGAEKDDRVVGNDGAIDYWLAGGGGNDLLTGNAGNDTLLGGDGDDTLRGGAGQDEYSGGAGNDVIYYASGDLFWDGGTPKDIAGAGIDTLIIEAGSKFNTAGLSWYGFEQFEGAEKNDRVDGNDASVDYLLDGGAGNDSLKGNGGADTLIGGLGDDGLTGGAGSDTFVFRFGETGHDTITDFAAGALTDDVIEFSSLLFSSFADVVAAATDDGVSSTITIDADTSITLTGVLVSQLHQDDFSFV